VRLVLVAVTVLAVGIGTVVLVVSMTGRSPTGCRVKSVDEATYVAGNRAILDELPVYPGATRTNTLSNGWRAQDACLPAEDGGGPPYDRYMTYDSYTLPADGRGIVSAPWKVPDEFGNTRVPARVPSVLVYYDRSLRETGWQRSHWSGCCEIYFKRGTALLAVTVQLNTGDPYKREPYHQLAVVHDE
jgi:hypothetical protein